MSRTVEIAFDTGGTFTDCVVVDAARRTVHGFKVLSTPHDPSVAIFEALAIAVKEGRIAPSSARIVLHATTVATNALIERKGGRVGLVTTQGFRDILEMRRETRYDETDLAPVFPPPLVPRRLRLGVAERMRVDGSVATPLDEADLCRVLGELAAGGVDALAICFLHSYANAAHERRAKAIAAECLPGAALSASFEVQPEVREYERMSTTVANAYLQGVVGRYVDGLARGLQSRGFDVPLRIMQSNGGFAGPQASARFPVRLVESGPAAGTIAAIHYGRRAGFERLVSFDMGGTTAKIAVLTGATPPVANELEVARVRRFKAGSGIPLRSPSVALNEIGAGGGSIARVDSLGLARVGPESAGADPGPVCYGRGGTEPTVTDADLVLGYLDPRFFAGGSMVLDRAAAESAIRRAVAEPLGLELTRAAWGIHDIVNQNMASAARRHILEQGEDPASFTMVAFGGAGPVHAHRVAHALGVGEVLYPVNAGVASAFGLLVAPMASDYVRTFKVRIDAIDGAQFARLVADMRAEAGRDLAEASSGAIEAQVSVDFRYVGQGFEVNAVLPEGFVPTHEALARLMRDAYRRLFGRDVQGVPLEIMNVRLAARAARGEAGVDFDAPVAPAGRTAAKGERPVYFDEIGRYVATPVYDRLALASGATIAGPAIIEEKDTTIVVPPGAEARVDAHLNVITRLAKEAKPA